MSSIRDDIIGLVYSRFSRRYFIPGDLIPYLCASGHRSGPLRHQVELALGELLREGRIICDRERGYRANRPVMEQFGAE